ncbi:MAG TPA: flavodoxin domain-containing protein [Jiangellaceae bacterium]
MKALVVYESMYGNTRDVAEAIGAGLSSRVTVEVVEVSSAPEVVGDEVELVVVGGPTHAFGMSRSSTRADAAQEAPVVSAGQGIREWVENVRLPAAVRAATFDTKVIKPRFPGSAAAAAAKRLRRKSVRLIAQPMTFYVTGKQGPVATGELGRARRWGEMLAPETRRVAA